jgi:SAM-dependent methyltransferase
MIIAPSRPVLPTVGACQPPPRSARAGAMLDPLRFFHDPGYLAINQARLEHLAAQIEGLPLGKSVLELGAGVGDHTGFWLERGFEVTATDGRRDLVEALRRRHPDATAQVYDLDGDDPPEGRFDVVYAYGLLYHLKDPAKGLAAMAETCRGVLLLETCVSFGEGAELNPVPEPQDSPTQSVHGLGCRPTRRWVFEALKRHFECVYQPIVQPDHPQFPLDWSSPGAARADLHRATFVASRWPLEHRWLRPRLVHRQNAFRRKGRRDAPAPA